MNYICSELIIAQFQPIELDKGSEVSEMNINQLKAFLSEKPAYLGKDNSIGNQLRDSGLRQAIDIQANQIKLNVDKFSSSSNFGVRIYSSALNNTLEINKQKPDFSVAESKSVNSSLFDFEEIAKNVLNFVGGAIKNAQNKGANDSELNSLLEQASYGVLKGIKLAEQDLAGFLNEDITTGIENSKNLIEKGIASIRDKTFNSDATTTNESVKALALDESTSVSYANQKVGELIIRTRDGNEVKLTFDDFRQFDFSQTQAQLINQERPSAEKEISAETQPVELNQQAIQSKPAVKTNDEPLVDPIAAGAEKEQVATIPVNVEQNAVFYQDSSLSFSVKGELDEDELKAISQLVVDTNELAEEFFNGDIETAFNQALDLGFDQQELAGFALQLTKVENTRVIKAYETISRFDEDNTDNDPAKAVKPVADYLDKLLNVLEGSRRQFENSNSYENVVNDLINRLGKDVATPDLISAINRFNEFNQSLLNNLPIGFQPQS
jgi:hypothetical protein